MRNLALFPILLMLSSFAILGQAQESTQKQSLILQFRQLTGADQVNLSINLSTEDVRQSLNSIVEKDPDLSESQKKEMMIEANAAYTRIDKIAKDFFANREVLNKLSEHVIFSLYDSTFTEPELTEIIAFYKTPTGQKVARFLPRLSAEAQKGFISAVLPKLQALIEPVSKAETEKLEMKIAEAKVNKPKN